MNPAVSSRASWKQDKEKSSLATKGEDQGRCSELGTALKNLSGYGERHVKRVVIGTGETLLYPQGRREKAYKQSEMVDCKEGVGGGHSTNDNYDINAKLRMYKNARLTMYIFDFPCIFQLYMEWRA